MEKAKINASQLFIIMVLFQLSNFFTDSPRNGSRTG